MKFKTGRGRVRVSGNGCWFLLVLFLAWITLAVSQPFPRQRFPRRRPFPHQRWPNPLLRNGGPGMRRNVRTGSNFGGQRNQLPFQQTRGINPRMGLQTRQYQRQQQQQQQRRQFRTYNDATTNNNRNIISTNNNNNNNKGDLFSYFNVNRKTTIPEQLTKPTDINETVTLQREDKISPTFRKPIFGGKTMSDGIAIRQELYNRNGGDQKSTNPVKGQNINTNGLNDPNASNTFILQRQLFTNRQNSLRADGNSIGGMGSNMNGLSRQSNRRNSDITRPINNRMFNSQRRQRNSPINSNLFQQIRASGINQNRFNSNYFQNYNSAQRRTRNFNSANSFRNTLSAPAPIENKQFQQIYQFDYPAYKQQVDHGLTTYSLRTPQELEHTTVQTQMFPKAPSKVLYETVALPSPIMRDTQETTTKRGPIYTVPIVTHISANDEENSPFSPVVTVEIAPDARPTVMDQLIRSEAQRENSLKHLNATKPVVSAPGPFTTKTGQQEVVLNNSQLQTEQKDITATVHNQIPKVRFPNVFGVVETNNSRAHVNPIGAKDTFWSDISKVASNNDNDAVNGILGAMSPPELVGDIKIRNNDSKSDFLSKTHMTPDKRVWGHFAPLKDTLVNSLILANFEYKGSTVDTKKQSSVSLNTHPGNEGNKHMTRGDIKQPIAHTPLFNSKQDNIGKFVHMSIENPDNDGNVKQHVKINNTPTSETTRKTINIIPPEIKHPKFSTGRLATDQIGSEHSETFNEAPRSVKISIKSTDMVTKPRGSFGTGMFGYRRTGDLPPNFQHSAELSTTEGGTPTTMKKSRPSVFSPIFGIGMPVLTDKSKETSMNAQNVPNPFASNMGNLMSDMSVRGRFLINQGDTVSNSAVHRAPSAHSLTHASGNPVRDADHLKTSGTIFGNKAWNGLFEHHLKDVKTGKMQHTQPPTRHTTTTTTTPIPKPDTVQLPVHNDMNKVADSILSLFMTDFVPTNVPSMSSYFAKPIVESTAGLHGDTSKLASLGSVNPNWSDPSLYAPQTSGNSIPAHASTFNHGQGAMVVDSNQQQGQSVDTLGILSTLNSNTGHLPVTNNNDQLNENIISSLATHQATPTDINIGVNTASQTNMLDTKSNDTNIQTIVSLIESMPSADLATVIANMNLPHSVYGTSDSNVASPLASPALVESPLASSPLVVSPLVSSPLASSILHKTGVTDVDTPTSGHTQSIPDGLDFTTTLNQPVSNQVNSDTLNNDIADAVSAILNSALDGTGSVNDQSIASTIANTNEAQIEKPQPDSKFNIDTNTRAVDRSPLLKIGNIKVASIHSSNTKSLPGNTYPYNNEQKVIVDPNLSVADFGVIVNQPNDQQNIEHTKHLPVAPTKAATINIDALLDDLLLGLTNLEAGPTTVAPTTTTTKATPTCSATSPTFKCSGKGMFKTLDTMGGWCVTMCKTSGCVESACECGCEKPKPQVVINRRKWKNKRKKVHNPKQKLKKGKPKLVKRKDQKPKANWKRPRLALHVRQRSKHGKRKHLRKKKKKELPKPKPTTEEPPEIEWEDIVTTTTAMPSTTEDIYWDLHSTISPFEDIKLGDFEATQVRAENIHLTKMPQVQWASEIRSRLKTMAKNAIEATSTTGWQEEPMTTTYAPYDTTLWDITPPVTSTAPPTREWDSNWPTPRPTDGWASRPRKKRPVDRWSKKPPRARESWRNGPSRHEPPPPRDSWRDSRPQYDPPPTHSSNQWEQNGWGGDKWSRGRDTHHGGHSSGYNGGWGNRNHGLRNSWGNRGSSSQNGGQEAPEAPDK